MNGKIYKIVNTVNGKIYIGQTIRDVKDRLERHKKDAKYGSNLPLHKAMRKYGVDNFKIEVIKSGIDSQDKLNNEEVYYINKYKSTIENGIGYNVAYGGYSGKGNRLITHEIAHKIQDLLKETDASLNEISAKFGISVSAVSDINRGKTWSTDGINYPIREYNKNKVKTSIDDVNKIKYMLKSGEYKSITTIAQIVGVDNNVVYRINSGDSFREDIDYPIMKTNSLKENVSSESKILNVIIDLALTDLDCKTIGDKYGLSMQSIQGINHGRCWSKLYPGRYPIQKYGYLVKEELTGEKDDSSFDYIKLIV